MGDEMRRIWKLIEKDVKRIDRERARQAKKSRRELLNEILAAEEKTNNVCRRYMSEYNIIAKPLAVLPEEEIKFSSLERLLLAVGLVKKKKVDEICKALEKHYYRMLPNEGRGIEEIVLLLNDLRACIKNL